jgi:hypothetical protein
LNPKTHNTPRSTSLQGTQLLRPPYRPVTQQLYPPLASLHAVSVCLPSSLVLCAFDMLCPCSPCRLFSSAVPAAVMDPPHTPLSPSPCSLNQAPPPPAAPQVGADGGQAALGSWPPSAGPIGAAFDRLLRHLEAEGLGAQQVAQLR